MALPARMVRGGMVLAGALSIALMAAAAPAPAQDGACADAGLVPDGRNGSRLRAAVVCLLNEERTSRGIDALEGDSRLQRAARRHSSDMVRRRYFGHVSPDGGSVTDRARAARYVPRKGRYRIAENIAWGAGSKGAPERIVAMWMKSRAHRRNILDRSLRHLAVGVEDLAPDGGEGATYTLLLGRRS